MNPTVLAGVLFLVTYAAIVRFKYFKSQILWGGIAAAIVLGLVRTPQMISDINWNVMGIFAGTLIHHARTGASPQRRTKGTATGQAPGLRTTKRKPAPTARTTPQRRFQ